MRNQETCRTPGTWIVFRTDLPGFEWCEIDQDGNCENVGMSKIIDDIRSGFYHPATFNLRLVPKCYDDRGLLIAKSGDCSTLGKEFAPAARRGSAVGLKPISEENRYKGKVDWELARPNIELWLSQGETLGAIAKRLGVSASTLSMANNRLSLYPKRQPVA